MGLIVDTVVFVAFERSRTPVDLSPWEATDEVFISAVTVSELLVGVHRADTESRRANRAAFVEAILAGITVLDFTTQVARVHAELHAELIGQGQVIGAHDLIIATDKPATGPAMPRKTGSCSDWTKDQPRTFWTNSWIRGNCPGTKRGWGEAVLDFVA